MRRGPSALVPSLMVGVLGLVICGPTLLYLGKTLLPLFQTYAEPEGKASFSFVMLLPVLLLLLVHLLSGLFPAVGRSYTASVQQTCLTGYDSDGFGLGTVLLVVIFWVLYHLM